MEIKYLKVNTLKPFIEKIVAVVKLTEGKTLHCYENQIEATKEDDDLATNVEWYKKELNYVKATKEEFDNFYIPVANLVNEYSKL